MKKVNAIRLLFLFVTVIGIGSYYWGYHRMTGNYPDIDMEIGKKDDSEIQNEEKTAEQKQDDTETAIASSNMQKPYQYVVLEEDGYLTVYYADRKTKYMDTDIRMDELETKLQKEIKTGKTFDSSEKLYDFLENYSS